ncbi:MAG: hypothetical protein AAB725_01645 [Patescibacteria group bacterium]
MGTNKKKNNLKNSSLPSQNLPGGALLAIVATVALFFAFYDVKSGPIAGQAASVESADPTFGWYLYQTKTNSFFQVKYPYSWRVIYGGGFAGEENLYVQSPDTKTTIKALARANEKYKDLDSFLKEINSSNGSRIGYQLISEEKIMLDGRLAVKREEYWTDRKTSSITTYVFDNKSIVQLQTDFPGSEFITSENKAFHGLVADTLKFVN